MRQVGAFYLEERDGVIVSIAHDGNTVQLGQEVVSNGRTLQKKGTRGRIERLNEPYEDSRTSNVIDVRWENGSLSLMKFKDLEL